MGSVQDDAGHFLHNLGGGPHRWSLAVHWGAAGIAVGVTHPKDYDWSPEEPMLSLKTDLGPLADADSAGAHDGEHFWANVAQRPGPWFDWVRHIVGDPARSAAQMARLKQVICNEVERAYVNS